MRKFQFKDPPLLRMGPRFNEMIEVVQDSQRSQRDLVANISHDLKTPLTSIQGFALAILDGTSAQPELHPACCQSDP